MRCQVSPRHTFVFTRTRSESSETNDWDAAAAYALIESLTMQALLPESPWETLRVPKDAGKARRYPSFLERTFARTPSGLQIYISCVVLLQMSSPFEEPTESSP